MKYNFVSALTFTLALTPTFSASATETTAGSTGIVIESFFARDSMLILTNYNTHPVSLEGWRFLTSNASVTNFQTDPRGLDGIVIEPFNTLRVQFDNNADVRGGINVKDLGDFADYQSQAFSITLFCPNGKGQVDFNNPSQAVDHIQWSINANHHPIADTHNQLAVDAGLWTGLDEWIDAREHMYLIEPITNLLTPLHGPEDYNVLLLTCRADINHDGNTNFFDVSAFLTSFSQSDSIADMNNDGEFNFFDVSLFLNYFTTNEGCF